jgi:hypothetical protein
MIEANTNPQYISGWTELAQLPDSETHRLEINLSGGYGWIKEKANDALGHYLSTHTFYGLNHKHSTDVLRRHGWNVTCANWDMRPQRPARDLANVPALAQSGGEKTSTKEKTHE